MQIQTSNSFSYSWISKTLMQTVQVKNVQTSRCQIEIEFLDKNQTPHHHKQVFFSTVTCRDVKKNYGRLHKAWIKLSAGKSSPLHRVCIKFISLLDSPLQGTYNWFPAGSNHSNVKHFEDAS